MSAIPPQSDELTQDRGQDLPGFAMRADVAQIKFGDIAEVPIGDRRQQSNADAGKSRVA